MKTFIALAIATVATAVHIGEDPCKDLQPCKDYVIENHPCGVPNDTTFATCMDSETGKAWDTEMNACYKAAEEDFANTWGPYIACKNQGGSGYGN